MDLTYTYNIKQTIKLVIWDLDDTIWSGTLAEKDDVILYSQIYLILETLNRRGIISSICSKNHFDTAKKKLQEFELWDQFVLPSINFTPKGPRVKQMLSDLQLRADNVLMVDDNVSELVEVNYFNKNINLLCVSYANSLLDDPYLKGSSDDALTRFKQYKQLEKMVEQRKHFEDNNEFLKSINIQISFIDYNVELLDRIHELIDRTNQLNYTKNRMSKAELEELLEDKAVFSKCIQVIDDFGDRGLVGFYALKDNTLIHFLFSCRILNMGIEQWVYTHLNCPKLTIVGQVASTVTKQSACKDYIRISNQSKMINDAEVLFENYVDESQITTIYAIGACDMFNMIGNLATPCNRIFFDTNTFKGNYRSVNIGSEYIRSCFDMSDDEKEFCKRHLYNYTSQTVFHPRIFDLPYDYVLFSFHDDFRYCIWEKKNQKSLRIVRDDEPVFGDEHKILNIVDQEKWFKNNFDKPHFIEEERLYQNLQWIRNELSPDTLLILLSGPEYNFFKLSNNKAERHNHELRNQIIRLNKVLIQFAQENERNVRLLDVNKFLTQINDFTDYIFHWTAKKCYEIAKECLRLIAQDDIRQTHNIFIRLPVDNRKIVIWGANSYTMLCNYSLIANGIDIDSICYHKQSEVLDYDIKSSDMLNGNRDQYYVIVIDEKNYEEIEQKLTQYGYNKCKDFIRFATPKMF